MRVFVCIAPMFEGSMKNKILFKWLPHPTSAAPKVDVFQQSGCLYHVYTQ